MPSQISHYSLVVRSATAAAAAAAVLNRTVLREPRFHADGLFAATTYSAQVRAHNRRGSSRWSARLQGTTPEPTRAPNAAPLSRGVLVDGASCTVSLPFALRTSKAPSSADNPADASACSGAEWVEVQLLRAGSAQWQTAGGRATATPVTLDKLEATSAYRFRLVARNRAGSSTASEPFPTVGGIVPGVPALDTLLPAVRATGSGSFVIEVPEVTAPCQVGLSWAVVVSYAGDEAKARLDPGAWEVLAVVGQGGRQSIDRLRCPGGGCRFAIRPDVAAFDDGHGLMGPSIVVNNAELPPVSDAAARVELRLLGAEWNSLLQRELRRGLALALQLPREPVVVEEHTAAAGGGLYLVIDLVASSAETAEGAARLLAAQLAEGDAVLRGQGVLSRADAVHGVHLQHRDSGAWVRVLPQPQQSRRGGFLGRASLGAGSSALVLGVLGVAVAFHCHTRCSGPRRPVGAVRLAQEEPFDPEVEVLVGDGVGDSRDDVANDAPRTRSELAHHHGDHVRTRPVAFGPAGVMDD